MGITHTISQANRYIHSTIQLRMLQEIQLKSRERSLYIQILLYLHLLLYQLLMLIVVLVYKDFFWEHLYATSWDGRNVGIDKDMEIIDENPGYQDIGF